ncbi:MAG TPA: isopentenyl phosphate kinase [Longimicrobiales bacterium]|nr:isopentenyl phosphate kinase [Longimicrobiales bacterium]
MTAPAITLLKLGGSLLTDKRDVEAARTAMIGQLARQIAAAEAKLPGALIVGHGSGSFGHAEAQARGLSRTPVRASPEGVAAVRAAAARLHELVLAALREAGARPQSIPPSAVMVIDEHDTHAWPAAGLEAALAAGRLPVVYGDVVLDALGRARIVSTEEVLAAVAASLRGAGQRILRAIWLGETDGVLDARGERIPELVAGRDAVPAAAGGAAGADVTGGMAHRVRTALALARRGVPSWIGDGRPPDALRHALEGREVGGTRVRPAAEPAQQVGQLTDEDERDGIDA